MSLRKVSLDDKFDLAVAPVYLNGTQALVRLCLMQVALDRQQGLRTAGYVSGYRGSPVGGLDQQFAAARRFLEPAGVIFESGLNEDLAATALWGTQQAELRGEGAYDGVFGMWYGKGPGVDRSGDVFRHANHAGTSRHGGVLVLMGDDHTCESSTTAHQSEYALMDAMIPIFNPANVQELIAYGLHGWALSRYAGVWCGLKCVKDNIESTTIVDARPEGFQKVLPADHPLPEGGLNIRVQDTPQAQEARLHRHKLGAVEAYLRANRLDRVVVSGGRTPRVGVVSTGKSCMDTLQAFEELGLDEARAAELGIALYKVAMPWPLEPEGITEFARGLDLLVVVEEKRGLIEQQLRARLYGQPEAPPIIGKRDEAGATLFQAEAALNPVQIAAAIGSRLARITGDAVLAARTEGIVTSLHEEGEMLAFERKPYFCAGCPHNRSTVIPEGSRAYAGIGCHWMAQFMDRGTEGFTHMGGEGANWIGESKFSKRRHIFQNIGDGTFNHSGIQAIRGAQAAGVHMTFKILYNDAVAMTGGQAHEGGLDVPQIAAEVAAIGVRRIALVSDDPSRHRARDLPTVAEIAPREKLQEVQRGLAEIEGVTVLIYEQTCAAEKRRRRKRGRMEDPPRRVFINHLVCEGCGDCGVQSNCVAIAPLETEFGRKRQIDQAACNKDYSCVNGFCPSFTSVTGGRLRKPDPSRAVPPEVPEPANRRELDRTYGIVLTGIGGTGVVTVAALIGMAAHLEGRGCGIIDMAGLAQKGGAVTSHIKLAPSPADIKAIRIAQREADLLLGGDLVVSATLPVLRTLDAGRSQVVVNTHEVMTGAFTHDPDLEMPASLMRHRLQGAVAETASTFADADRIARALIGESIAANFVLVGIAYQRGALPLGAEAIEAAIALNGVSVESNQRAFRWGRAWAQDPAAVEALAAAQFPGAAPSPAPETLEERIGRWEACLSAYQNQAHARRYRNLVERARACDGRPDLELTEAVARNAFRLMSYKDEYEVARLYTDGRYEAELRREFEGDYRLKVHLAPPLLTRTDPVTGRIRKREFGGWVFAVFRVLARLRGLRGTPFDIFGYSAERCLERELMREYEVFVTRDLARIAETDYGTATELARLPEIIRGFGPVKADNVELYRRRRAGLLERREEIPAQHVDAA